MTRRYWAEIDGERIYRASLDAIKRIAQDTADKLGRVVRVGYDDAPPARRNPAARTDAQMAKLSDSALERAIEKASERDSALGQKLSPEHRNIVYSELRKIRAPDVQAYVAAREATHDLYAHQRFRKSHGSSYVRKLYARNPAKPGARRRQRVGGPSPKLAYFAGVMAARDGLARASNPHYGAEAKAWREGYDYVVKHYRPNPDPGHFIPFWREQEKGRKMRLNYLAATKARRLAKGLSGRDRGGAVKAAERRAAKTGKFVVRVSGAVVNGVRQPPLTLYRASRASADALGAGFEAAGCKVTIAPV